MLSPSFFTEIAALLSAYLGSSLKRQQWGNTVISVVGLILFSSSGIVVPVSDFLCKSITIQNNQEITSKESIDDDGKGLDVCNQHGQASLPVIPITNPQTYRFLTQYITFPLKEFLSFFKKNFVDGQTQCFDFWCNFISFRFFGENEA